MPDILALAIASPLPWFVWAVFATVIWVRALERNEWLP
jgi:hypothetical protein